MNFKKTAFFELSVPLRVTFADTDAMGIVWHGNYYRYFEEARSELLRAFGLDIHQVENMGFHFPVIKSECKYIKPLRYPMNFNVLARLIEFEYKIGVDYEIRVDGQKMAQGITEHAVINSKTFELYYQVPDILKEIFIRKPNE